METGWKWRRPTSPPTEPIGRGDAALALTGLASSSLGGARPGVPIARNVLGGLAAMAVTYAIGAVVGARVG